MPEGVGFFSYLWNTVLNFFGYLCGNIYGLATLTTKQLARYITAPESAELFTQISRPFNMFTGENIQLTLVSLSDMLNNFVVSTWQSVFSVGTNPIDIVEWIVQALISGILWLVAYIPTKLFSFVELTLGYLLDAFATLGFGDLPAWLGVICILVLLLLPLGIFKAVRKILW